MEWHTLHLLSSSSDEVIMEAEAMADSSWFSGHFPDDPVLPGIAQIAMVFEAVKHLAGENRKITGVKRVRFKQIIRPNDRLTITVSSGKENTCSFRILLKGEPACTGILSVNNNRAD